MKTHKKTISKMLSFRFTVPLLGYTLSPPPPKYKHISSIYYHNGGWRITRDHKASSCIPKLNNFVVAAWNAAAAAATAEERLPEGLRRELMPRHVAVIMDGNRRWAQDRGLPAESGHRAGRKRMDELAELCGKWGVKVLTVFAFSTENWARSKVEVDLLMSLFEELSKSVLETWVSKGIKFSMIGDLSKLPKPLSKLLVEATEATKANSRLHFVMAINYSGQYDITQACKTIASKVKDGLLLPESINQSSIEQELETKCSKFPCPDLVIRSSGENRISNFMLWQLAYSELYFVDVLFPDFGKAEFTEALRSFQNRQRRYGGHGYSG